MRNLLRQRAFSYEDLKQYDRAEADYNTALLIEPLDPCQARLLFFPPRTPRRCAGRFPQGWRTCSDRWRLSFRRGRGL
jgi:hypothetical protein